MTEKNRDILKKAISEMSSSRPKPSGWNEISSGLDNLDGARFMSNNLKKLPAYKAPSGNWAVISASLGASSAGFFKTWYGRMTIALFATGVVIMGYTFFFSPERVSDVELSVNNQIPPEEYPIKELIEETNDDAIMLPSTVVENDPNPESKEPLKNATIETKDFLSKTQRKTAGISSIKKGNDKHDVKSENIAEICDLSDSASGSEKTLKNTKSLNQEAAKILSSFEIKNIDHSSKNVFLQYRKIDNPAAEAKSDYAKHKTKPEIKTGAFYAYKRFRDPGIDGVRIPQNLSSFGLELVLEKNRWFVKTAVSYLGWKEQGNYSIDYDQYQLVYEYNYVDSTFIDPSSGHITYYTTETSVYDSVQEFAVEQSENQYKMLQIPLILGYKLINTGRFQLSLIGGAGIDIRLSGKQFIPVFDEEGASINETNNSLKYRTGNNWRLIGGLEFGYGIGRQWELYAEPSYQHYMKPYYSPDDSKSTGLFNLKLGLRYILR